MTRWSRSRTIFVTGLTLVAVLAGAWMWKSMVPPPPPVGRLLVEAKTALRSGQLETASDLCEQALKQDSRHVPTLLVAGDTAMRAERFADALKFFRAVPVADTDDSVSAQLATAEVLRATGHLAEAEMNYRNVIQRRPSYFMAHERLAFILDLQGRRWESVPHLLEQLRQDHISFSVLIRLGTRESAIPFPEELNRVRLANHAPAAVKLAEAVGLLAHHHVENAETLLRDVIDLRPELTEAHARLGSLLADHDISRIPDWQRQLLPQGSLHPDVQTARGLWCVQAGQNAAAIRCFQEAAAIDANQRIALYQLGQLLAAPEFNNQPNFAAAAIRCADRSKSLQKLAATMNQLSLNRSDTAAMQSASKLLETLGRYWEAYGWCGLALLHEPNQKSTRRRMQQLATHLSPAFPLTDSTTNPATGIVVADFPRPEWPAETTNPKLRQRDANPESKVVFVDRADDANLNFTYFHGRDQVTAGTKMYEFAGGGVGILDFDGNGLPDVYLTQGCPWPPTKESTEYRDRLFCNLGNGRFRDVTDQANLGDGWFSQGVAVGDLNSDGWPDLYIANIGKNTLYRNNGDGTYQEITESAGLSGQQWTTSCLVADLNGDHSPDLYDVNYLKGDDLFERLCLVEGRQRACVPGVFSAEKDRILVSQSDGRYLEFPSGPNSPLEPPRPGMGLVAFDADGSGRLSLFVANDVMANAFLMNETEINGGRLQLHENALLSGLAFDRDGRAQACMGVAADDFNNDGLADILVTNYFEEGNSLYLQVAPGKFIESSRPVGVYNASLRQLGFGTQFLDADLDGALDLVVANGHLDDFSYLEIPYRMRPQFFSNNESGQLLDVTQASGSYFERDLLGRSLATLDWNMDGRPDFIVMHIGTPIALVSNETVRCGHWLKLRLHGTASSRDAFGCSVTVECGEQTWTRQLVAGSGYQASNERMLIFGLGGYTQVDRMTIRWPSGAKQTFKDVSSRQELAIIENTDRLFKLPSIPHCESR